GPFGEPTQPPQARQVTLELREEISHVRLRDAGRIPYPATEADRGLERLVPLGGWEFHDEFEGPGRDVEKGHRVGRHDEATRKPGPAFLDNERAPHGQYPYRARLRRRQYPRTRHESPQSTRYLLESDDAAYRKRLRRRLHPDHPHAHQS